MRITTLCVVLAVWLAPGVAQAGGFYLLPRGARTIAQGGAAIAGSDDPGAMWFNPAGLAYSGNQVLVDFVLPIANIEYTRINSGGEVEPTMSQNNVPLPLPGFALSYKLRDDLTMGAGLLAPTAALFNWPRTITDDMGQTQPAPTRYSMLSMAGSGLGFINLGLAYRPIKQLTIGATFVSMVGLFNIDIIMSVCDNAVLCSQPESPRFDADANINIPFVYSPGGQFGAILDLDYVKIGVSYMTGLRMSGTARFTADLPEEEVAAFRGARMSNDKADFVANFPMIARAGVEVTPMPELRVEATFGWEDWSVQDAMKVSPRNITITGAPGIGDYQVGDIRMERGMQDSYSVGLGAQYQINPDYGVRAGYFWERSSLPEQYMSIMTPDSNKNLIGAGLTWAYSDAILVDFSVGHAFFKPVSVRNSKVYQPFALRPPPPEPEPGNWQPGEAVPLGNGDYRMRAFFVGLGMRMKLD